MPIGIGTGGLGVPAQTQDDLVEVINPAGRGDFVLVCEHASNIIPEELHNLGLEDDVLQSHVAWDPGAKAVAVHLAGALDAPLVAPKISRLVFDCNRAADAPSAIPHQSEIYSIPGNENLSNEECRARAERYYMPFHDLLGDLLDERTAQGRMPILVTVHSFTPVYHGVKRDLELGILHDADARFADALVEMAHAGMGEGRAMVVRRNAPYGPEDGVTFTLLEHAEPRGLLNAMLEIRNDLIATPDQQQAMAKTLAGLLTTAMKRMEG